MVQNIDLLAANTSEYPPARMTPRSPHESIESGSDRAQSQ
jgi:hypothetical protein